MAITKVVKGNFYVRERGIKYNFMFNPSEIKVTKGANFPNEIPAGASYPVYNYASGGEHLISFTLPLDGDRGRSDKRPKSTIGPDRLDFYNAGTRNSDGTFGTLYTVNSTTVYQANDLTAGGNTSLNIDDEVRLLMSLTLPSKYGSGVKDVYPHFVMFTLGEQYKMVPVIVKKANPTYTMWTPKMEPMRASVEIELAVVVKAYTTAAEFQSSSQELLELGAPASDNSLYEQGLSCPSKLTAATS